MTGVLLVYGVYAPLVGYLNGRRLFVRQATLDVVAATLRTGLLLGAGWLMVRRGGALAGALHTSPGVLGATAGAVTAAIGVFLLALRWTGTGSALAPGAPLPAAARGYLAGLVPIMVGQLFTNGLMQADILVLGRYLSLAAPSPVAANEWVGVYRACQLFAFLPYQLLFSVTQILFPMLAAAGAQADAETRVAELVRRGCRIGAIVCGMLVCVVLALPGSLVKFAYTADIAARAAGPLRWLAIGQAAFAMLSLATTILVSLGKERDAMTITAVALACVVTANVLGLPRATFGEAQLVATAQATTFALAAAMAVAVLRVRAVARAFVPLGTALRVGACVAVAFLLGGLVPVLPKLVTPIAASVVVASYLLALVATRELGREDLGFVTSVLKRRAARGAPRP
jgi:stage V sporulation protein B